VLGLPLVPVLGQVLVLALPLVPVSGQALLLGQVLPLAMEFPSGLA
jgi:hypothetical protein